MDEAQNNGKNQIFQGFEAITQKCFGISFKIWGTKPLRLMLKWEKKFF